MAVITNGSLLYLPEVRQDLAVADAVLPSLDAGNSDLYKRINRPHPDLTFKSLIDGLKIFRKEYDKKLWVEVMLVRDLNDSEVALREISINFFMLFFNTQNCKINLIHFRGGKQMREKKGLLICSIIVMLFVSMACRGCGKSK